MFSISIARWNGFYNHSDTFHCIYWIGNGRHNCTVALWEICTYQWYANVSLVIKLNFCCNKIIIYRWQSHRFFWRVEREERSSNEITIHTDSVSHHLKTFRSSTKIIVRPWESGDSERDGGTMLNLSYRKYGWKPLLLAMLKCSLMLNETSGMFLYIYIFLMFIDSLVFSFLYKTAIDVDWEQQLVEEQFLIRCVFK